jgi:hypothetical protein
MEWKGFKLSHELHLRETVRDIKFLHDETMYSPSPPARSIAEHHSTPIILTF